MSTGTSHPCTTTSTSFRRWFGIMMVLFGFGQLADGQFIPRNSPPSYVDDVYHCLDPLNVTNNNIIDCNPDTWRWNRTQLLVDSPPTPCITEWNVDITSFLEEDNDTTANANETDATIINTVYVVEDRFEPCALWMMAYGPFDDNSSNTTTDTNTTTIDEEEEDMLDGLEDDASSSFSRPANIPNDLYHCYDPSTIDLETNIPCDPTTYEWDLDALVSSSPPPICQGRPSLIGASNLPDYLEPCVFWTLKYGTLDGNGNTSGSGSGTAAPSLPPDSNESLDGIVVIDPLLVTLVWPSQIFSSSALQEAAEAVFSLDRNELRDITERHVLEALLAGLGDSIVATVNIILTSNGIPSQGTWKERLTGTVTLQEEGAQLPSSTVNRLIQEAFVGTARELYQFRLQIANDPTLRQLQSVRIEGIGGESSTDVFDNSNFNTENGDDDDDDDGLDQILIIVIASCAAALVAVCAFGYCLFLYATHQVSKKAEAQAQALAASRSYKSSVASSSRASRVSIYNLPMVEKTAKASTTSALGERPIREGDYEDDDDEENQMSLISMSAFGDYDAERGANGNNNIHHNNSFGDNYSAAGTSVYSYFNHADNTTTGGGTSTAEDQSLTNDTFLASIIDKRGGLYDDESTLASYSPVSKKKTFSVLDTLSKYGDIAAIWKGSKRGSDDDDEEDYNNSQQQQQQQDNNEDYIAGLDDPLPMDADQSSQANHTAGSESGAFSVSMDDVEDYESEMGGSLSPATMPVKERMEQMWAQDDETKTIQTKEDVDDVNEDNERDIKVPEELASSSQPTKNRHVKVFQDDGSGNHSGSGSGAAAINTSFDSDDSPASTLQSSKARGGAIVNLLPTDHDGEEDDDASADGMALRLPNQLQTEHYMNSDAMSQSSSLSSRSGRSNRSSGSSGGVGGLDNKYGAASLKAQADALLQHQGDLSDSDQGSFRSSDSAMYRSLLKQDDTNDAPLFGKDQRKSSQQKQPQQLSNLIQSFDDVWSKDEKDGKEQPVAVSRSSSGNDIDSDEDDIYLEADDEDEPDNAQSDANSITSGASKVVQELSSLLLPGMQLFTTPAKDDQDPKNPSSPELPGMNLFTHSTSDGSKENNLNAQDPSPNKVMDFPDPTQNDDKEQPTLEGKLSFEIQDSDDESVGMHDPSAAAAQETAHVARNMERLRRLSLSGYAETMASF